MLRIQHFSTRIVVALRKSCFVIASDKWPSCHPFEQNTNPSLRALPSEAISCSRPGTVLGSDFLTFSIRSKPFKFIAAFLLCLSLHNCQTPAPVPLDFDQVSWQRYTNPIAKYTLLYPDVYKVEEEDRGGVFFRHNDVPVVGRFTDEEEGRERGAWFGSEPIGQIRLAGKQGSQYIYNHFDGPAYVRTIAYVIEHQGKFLGLEFRTDADELDKVQKKILKSFKIGVLP